MSEFNEVLVAIGKTISYCTAMKKVSINSTLLNKTLWLPKRAITKLCGVEIPAINKHLGNIYESGEWIKDATISILKRVQNDVCPIE